MYHYCVIMLSLAQLDSLSSFVGLTYWSELCYSFHFRLISLNVPLVSFTTYISFIILLFVVSIYWSNSFISIKYLNMLNLIVWNWGHSMLVKWGNVWCVVNLNLAFDRFISLDVVYLLLCVCSKQPIFPKFLNAADLVYNL